MKQKLLSAVRGALTGIALQYLLAIVLSVRLNLGYLMAYVTTLAEKVGGEMNAVILEAALAALLGMGVSLAVSFAREKTLSPCRRRALSGTSLLAGIAPAALVLIRCMTF